ncbi:MAG: Ldh family oxidoreductase [Rhodothermales bacterium]
MSTTTRRFPADRLLGFVESVFIHYEIPAPAAREAARILVSADLRGIDSHGVARLRAYVELLDAGAINPRPDIRILRQTRSTATVDGDNGLGLVVGPYANRLAIEKARDVGSGWVSVCNSNHYGIAGHYPLEALEHGVIGISMTNTGPSVTPLWGAQRMLGTNPIAIAFPGEEEPPIVIDLATSVVAFGKIEIAHRKQEPIPEGWALDREGNPITDPARMMDGGLLLPLGSTRDMGGHKGYGLSAMVDILCGVLSGANWGPFAPPFAAKMAQDDARVGRGIGHFFGAMDLAGFIDPATFKRQIDHWIRTFRATKPAPGTDGPLIPGDPEREAEADRGVNGIPLLPPVVEDLRAVGLRCGVAFP